MAALQHAKDNCLPLPLHLYGKSNGGYVVAKFLELPVTELTKGVTWAMKRKARELIGFVGSVTMQCPYLNQVSDVEALGRVANSFKVKLPPVLFLLAGEDRMLEDHNQPVDVGVKAARAIAGSDLLVEEEHEVTNDPRLTSSCNVQRGGGGATRRPRVEVRMYSSIGHTFVMDAQDKLITDGSCAPVIEHASNAAIAFIRAQMIHMETFAKLMVFAFWQASTPEQQVSGDCRTLAHEWPLSCTSRLARLQSVHIQIDADDDSCIDLDRGVGSLVDRFSAVADTRRYLSCC